MSVRNPGLAQAVNFIEFVVPADLQIEASQRTGLYRNQIAIGRLAPFGKAVVAIILLPDRSVRQSNLEDAVAVEAVCGGGHLG